MEHESFNKALMRFIGCSPTPFHAVRQMVVLLEDKGFRQLHEHNQWDECTGKYYVVRNDSSIVAFSRPPDFDCFRGIHMAGAHTDSPCLRIKPNPVLRQQGYFELGVEVYGGVLLNPWFDRDLSVAGRVSFLDKQSRIQSALINFQRPLAIIPSLAIHLDRKANEQRSINAQTDIVPVLMQTGDNDKTEFSTMLADQLRAENEGLEIEKVLDYELSLYDTQSPATTGFNKEFISSARLDNLLSCFVGLRSLIDAGIDSPCLLVCNDHEEVGSASSSGAHGPFLKSVLQRIAGSAENLTRLIDQSMMISCDNAHAVHPNYSQKHDGNHGPLLNHGPVIKRNANQRYATNSETSARFKLLCEQADVPFQEFVMRSDMACGSTIGPITAAEVGIRTVDVGVPQFAMHSIRETCGSKDPYYLYQVLKEFYAGNS